jgi:excisionase family DNA binding protein
VQHALQLRARLLTTHDISKWLGISRRTVCLWAECNQLPGVKLGRQWRFYEAEVQRWLTLKGG